MTVPTLRRFSLLLLLLIAATGCTESRLPLHPVRPIESPPIDGNAAQPRLLSDERGLLLSWIEDGVRLRFATGDGVTWDTPHTVIEDESLLANWADYPSVVRAPDGTLAAHWLIMRPAAGFAYDAWFSTSTDAGITWNEPVLIHDDDTDSEHGFVSIVTGEQGEFDLFWLDGRGFVAGGSGFMELRHRNWSDGRFGPENVIDEDVCTCCDTAALRRDSKIAVAYRGHTQEEIRDIKLAYSAPDGSSETQTVHDDGWVIAACPVNGPALAGTDDDILIGWFTAAENVPRVRARFYKDGSPGEVLTLSETTPVGRVDTAFLQDGSAMISWLDRNDEGGLVRLAWYRQDHFDQPEQIIDLGVTSAGRRSGFPRIAAYQSSLFAVWTVPESDESFTHLQLVAVDFTADQASR